MSDYKQCQECGDDSDKYIAFILYDCSECIKKKLCGSCMEWTNFNTKNKKPFCPECYDKKEVCCECGSDDQCDDQYFCLYKCCKCNEYNICNKCINWTNEDRGDPICSVCDEKYIQEQRKKRIVQQIARIEQLKKIVCSVCINTLDFRCYSNNLNDNLCSKCVILANKTI